MSRNDYIHLTMIFTPVLLIIFLLMTPKDAIGCGPITDFFGAVTSVNGAGNCQVQSLPWFFEVVRNSAGDAGSAGWWASALLMAMFFIDKEIRRQPGKLIHALAEAGVMVSTLYLMFLAVSVINFCLTLTGLSNYIARDAAQALTFFGGSLGQNGLFLFIALSVTMLLAILLGMGMPTVPAYLNVALLMGPLLSGLGIANFTANMFIFYFAVASAITPPVAVAAFAAASITKADPIMTGFSAVKSGIVMFVIPFVFAFYPELLLIAPAQIDPNGVGGAYLPGYDGTTHWPALAWLCLRITLGLYLLGSVLAQFDRRPLSPPEMVLRLALALFVVTSWPMLSIPAIGVAVALLFWHARRAAVPA